MPAAVDILGVLPFVASEAAYVAVVRVGEPAELIVRTYDAEGVALADVLTVADPGTLDEFSFPHAAFIRGATENSLAGCSVAFVLDFGRDLHMLDLEALALVAPATTHRPAETGGMLWSVTVRSDGAIFWECGVLAGSISFDPGTSQVGWLRRLSQDGVTIDLIEGDVPNPFAGIEGDTGMIETRGGPIPVSNTEWAIGFENEGDSTFTSEVAMKRVNESGTVSDIDERYLGIEGNAPDGTPFTIPVGMVLGATAGSPLTRVVVDTEGVDFGDGTSRYIEEALFALTGFTPVSSSVNRDGKVLVWNSAGASRICTWDGTHPIGDADDTPGPTFAGGFEAESETLLWLFSLL